MASTKKPNYITYVIITCIIIAVIVATVILLPKPVDYSYNGFVFEKQACPGSTKQCWYGHFEIDKKPYVITFYYHPKDVENIPIPAEALRLPEYSAVANHTIYITLPKNPPGNIGIAGVQLARLLGTRNGIFNLNVKGAEAGINSGQISCANASKNTVVLSIEQATIDAVYITAPNCIGIGATSDERAIAVADAYSYRLLGVIATPKSLLKTTPKPTNKTLANNTNATLPR